MRVVWIFIFAAMMAYVAWWLIYAIRKQIVYEVEMALGVGSLWAAFLAPALFEGSPALVTWPSAVSLFIVQPDGELEARAVEVGLTDLVNAEILSGLESGEVVSLGGAE